MTTLVMVAILLFGILGYRAAAGERSAERGLPDHPGERESAGRESRHDGVGRGHAAGKAILDHRGH